MNDHPQDGSNASKPSEKSSGGHLGSSSSGLSAVIDQAQDQLQTFFDELKNGTTNYKTVTSLGGQIAQEYRGRCILELLQNAHDALADAGDDDPRQITFVLISSPEPVLLIGNSGRPFIGKDFKGICQLGQSPKDPNESVGNKGLGFRSVLEVCSCPEIWSTAPAAGEDAFVFRFDPAVCDAVAMAAADLDKQGLEARSPFDEDRPLLDWSEEQLAQYRERLSKGLDVAKEAKSLSPYLMPLPIQKMPPEVGTLLNKGFKTIIRLRLDGGRDGDEAGAIQTVKDQLKLLDERAIVFLANLRTLDIRLDDVPRTLERKVTARNQLSAATKVSRQSLTITCAPPATPDSEPREFQVWSRIYGGADETEAERIREKVQHLPNRWPELRTATVGVAVEDTAAPTDGVFVIFLPTTMATGTSALINAPFYGSLDRRQIDFKDHYNELLIEWILDLCLDVIADLAAGVAEVRSGRAIVDLLSSAATINETGLGWSFLKRLHERSKERQGALDELAFLHCDGGWCLAKDARVMPTISAESSIAASVWRESAGFQIVSDGLGGRRKAVVTIIEALNGTPNPTSTEWSNTIQIVAARVKAEEIEVTWDGFLSSVIQALPDKFRNWKGDSKGDPLAECEFIPTQDGRLLSVSGSATIFFQPVQGADDAAELVGDVPKSLESRVAFLHPSVATREGTEGKNTPVQKFLVDRFVRGFRREDLLREVVLQALPKVPAPHDGEEGRQCAEIFSWALELVGEKGSTTLDPLIKRLPVACHGGWRSMEEAVFGPGWDGHLGDCLWELADDLPVDCGTAIRDCALLPPNDPLWGASVVGKGQLFTKAGVVDGLRLQTAPKIQFGTDRHSHEIPQAAPEGFPVAVWEKWENTNGNTWRPYYAKWSNYEISGIYYFLGMPYLENLSKKGINALSHLLFASFPSWPAGWRVVTVHKVSGNEDRQTTPSPLYHWLSSNTWLPDRIEVNRPIAARWLVPEIYQAEQQKRFAHLDPLPATLARQLRTNSQLREFMVDLGLNVYPSENELTGPELLNALANSWKSRRVPRQRFEIFLGQVREAWKHFDPEMSLPKQFLVRDGLHTFSVCEKQQLSEVYLPDNRERARSLLQHGKAVLEMHPRDAIRLANALLNTSELQPASKLDEVIIIDGSPWEGGREELQSLEGGGYAWLPAVLLTIAAYGGTRATGTMAKTWLDASERLRRANLVECESIKAQLMDGQEVVAASEPESHWLPGNVFVMKRDATFRHERLAFASQAALGRQDLLKDLLLVLGSLNGVAHPTTSEIEVALERAEIEAQAYADVLLQWAGSISILLDRIRPLAALLGRLMDFEESHLADVDELKKWLESNVFGWSAEDIVAAARNSANDRMMGLAAWRALGEAAQLPLWNIGLSQLGIRYAPVDNRAAKQQTEAHLDQVSLLLSALARNIAIKEGKAGLFLEMEAVRREFKAPAEWTDQWWEVPFQAVIGALHAEYAKLDIPEDRLSMLTETHTAQELRSALEAREVALDPDPYDLAADNTEAFRQTLLKLHDFREAWKELADGVSTAGKPPDLPADLDLTAYLKRWSETELIEKSQMVLSDPVFQAACDGCSTLDEIRGHLRIDAAIVEAHRKERLKLEQEAERKQRTFEVAGSPFEVGAGNYRELFEGLKNLAPPTGPRAINDEFTPLKHVPPGGGGSGGGTGGKGGKLSSRRPSKELTELVGIVGEMHAYRFLQREFGPESVRRRAWVSELSLKVQPLDPNEKDETSDAHGFDFRFRCGKKLWHVEVKATLGDDSQFELGTSEIRAASSLAGSPDQPWRILRITNALSAEPTFEWLPNPFEVGARQHYRLQEGGMRVFYARDKI